MEQKCVVQVEVFQINKVPISKNVSEIILDNEVPVELAQKNFQANPQNHV